MRILFLFSLVVLALSASRITSADELGSAATRAALCQADIEGAYEGSVGDLVAHFNLFCLGGSQPVLAMTLYDHVEHSIPNVYVNFPNSDIGNNSILFANFAIGNADRPAGSSKSTIAYIKLNLAKFKQNQFFGTYINGTMDSFSKVQAVRTHRFPRLVASLKETLAVDSLQGSYLISYKDWQQTYLIFDVLADTPVIGIVARNQGFNLHFTVGPSWSPSGVFESMTCEGNGGEPDDHKLDSIRGRFLDENHIEFYLISSDVGAQGPMLATRDPRRVPAALGSR
jgi:hypothetical protein